MPNCHEVRSSRLLQRIPRVQDLVLFYVFFMSSTSLTLSSSDIHVPEIFFLNFSAIILLWDFYLQFCSPDNPLGAYCLQRSLPPTGIQVCRSSTTTTVDHQQKIPNPIPNPKSYCHQLIFTTHWHPSLQIPCLNNRSSYLFIQMLTINRQ